MAKRITIDDMRELAKSRGGRCLSLEYINYKTKLKWQCGCGHEWEALPSNIIKGTWCPLCARKSNAEKKRLDINEMHRIAKSRNGKCLSTTYIDSTIKLLWECELGHQWEATPNAVKRRTWCPVCARTKYSIEDMNQLASKRGGKCLSTIYRGVSHKLTWECINGHRWDAIPGSILNGTWCPYCSGVRSINENLCRKIFELAFRDVFPKCRPNWLKATLKSLPLELDGFCEGLKLAFEYQGEQHYKPMHYNGEQGFKAQVKRDLIKSQLCSKNEITLIVIPPQETGDTKGLFAVIQDDYQKQTGRKFPTIDLSEVRLELKSEIDKLQDVAKEKGGICLSSSYMGARRKLKWECDQGHQWMATPDNIKRGKWCPECAKASTAAKKIKYSIENLMQFAEAKGGKCLSTKYITTKQKYEWQCSKGHRWPAAWEKIKFGRWCPICGREKSIASRRKYSLADLEKVAANKEGKILSDTYYGYHEKHRWECVYGHQWEAKPASVLRGSWCPVCANVVRRSIEEMKQIAKSRGGECLSHEYKNTDTKLKWRCSCGKIWEAIPASIKRGSWCPICSKKKKK